MTGRFFTLLPLICYRRLMKRRTPKTRRPEGTITRGTTAPNRLRRVDRWITATMAGLLSSSDQAPLVVDLGFGALPVTTIELYRRLRTIRADVEVVGLEIDPARVEEGVRFLARGGAAADCAGVAFQLGGFEMPTSRPPLLIRALNVLRQYDEHEVEPAWDRLGESLAPGGVLVEGTCDEIGRRAVWITLGRCARTTQPRTITFSARTADLACPSHLAERLPKALIHHNVAGEPIHRFLADFDRAWALSAALSVFGARQRWIAAVEHLASTWPVFTRPPLGGRTRWRLGEVTLPWAAVAPAAVSPSSSDPNRESVPPDRG